MPILAAQYRLGRKPPKSKKWLTVLDMAREYNVSRQTIYSLCQKGTLPFYVIPNGRRRFLRSEVEHVMRLRRVPAAENDPLNGYAGYAEGPLA